jgi:hypothetical protein
MLHCATIGAAEAIEAINRTNTRHWREHKAKAEEKCLIKRHDPSCVARRSMRRCASPLDGGVANATPPASR